MKKYMVICAPVTSVSGYGAHARDLVKSFIDHDSYEINIIHIFELILFFIGFMCKQCKVRIDIYPKAIQMYWFYLEKDDFIVSRVFSNPLKHRIKHFLAILIVFT